MNGIQMDLIETEMQVLNKISQVDSEENDKNPSEKDRENVTEKKGANKDTKTIIFLMYLYFLQGLPIGLAGAIPLILSSRRVSYANQGTFSFVIWPFSIKLLWAPIIDSLYIRRFGRRKTWLVPIQFFLGVMMLVFGRFAQSILDRMNNVSNSDVVLLTLIFAALIFLVASQDIVVDGWALSMLSKENVSWQSTCNGVGQTTGIFLGNILFVLLESADFSNKYIRSLFGSPKKPTGLITLQHFMYFVGSIFIVTTLFIMIFKKERNREETDENDGNEMSPNAGLSLLGTYKVIFSLFRIKSIRIVVLILLTVKLGFATEAVNNLKLIEYGVSKEKITLFSIPLTPLNILWPLIISKYTKGPKAIVLYLRAVPFKVIILLVISIFVFFTPYFKDLESNEYPGYYYGMALTLFALLTLADSTLFISSVSFFANISDESIGGTYMTLLATISNLGGVYPSTLILYLINFLTFKKCLVSNNFENTFVDIKNKDTLDFVREETLKLISNNTCSTNNKELDCKHMGGYCETTFDAFYFLAIVCALISLIWQIVFRNIIRRLASKPKSEWIPN